MVSQIIVFDGPRRNKVTVIDERALPAAVVPPR